MSNQAKKLMETENINDPGLYDQSLYDVSRKPKYCSQKKLKRIKCGKNAFKVNKSWMKLSEEIMKK